MTQLVKRLQINQQGRDFIFGDVHGRWDLVEELKQHVGFNEKQDRAIFVGDLVDRCTVSDALESWKLMSKPSHFVVRGNHENDLQAAFQKILKGTPSDLSQRYMDAVFLTNLARRHDGKVWLLDVPDYLSDIGKTLQEFLTEMSCDVSDLPLLIQIEDEGEVLYRVAHAGIWNETAGRSFTSTEIDAIDNGSASPDVVKQFTDVVLFSGRALALKRGFSRMRQATPPAGDPLTICGHTPTVLMDGSPGQAVYLADGAHLNIDTGACFEDGCLTMVEIRKGHVAGLTLHTTKPLFQQKAA